MTNFDIKQPTIESLLNKWSLEIPDFQRSFIWKKDKKQLLIDSIWNGFPIGSLTLYDNGDEKNKDSYFIIDGLQRICTLTQFFTEPSAIISFSDYYDIIRVKVMAFLKNDERSYDEIVFKNIIKDWYNNLKIKFEFHKVSKLVKIIEKEVGKLDIEFGEEFLKILIEPISFENQQIPVITYKGDLDDLPLLFKNINTGTMPLSQYEVYRSVWYNFLLDKTKFTDIYKYYVFQNSVLSESFDLEKGSDEFRIFDNLIALSIKLCCIEDLDILFPGFKVVGGNNEKQEIKVYYDKKDISFEIISTILIGASNKINTAVNKLFLESENDVLNEFISSINEVIYESVILTIEKIKDSPGFKGYKLTKYHAYYLLVGMIYSRYNIDSNNYKIKEIMQNNLLLNHVFDIEKHKSEEWFIDKNRQMNFFVAKINEIKNWKFPKGETR